MSKTIELLEQRQLRKDRPRFKAGDTVRVHFQVIEGQRRRIQVNAICPTRAREVVLDASSGPPVPFGDASGDGFRTPEEVADLVIFLLSDGGRLHHRPEAHVVEPLPATPSRNGATPT